MNGEAPDWHPARNLAALRQMPDEAPRDLYCSGSKRRLTGRPFRSPKVPGSVIEAGAVPVTKTEIPALWFTSALLARSSPDRAVACHRDVANSSESPMCCSLVRRVL
jgi:hypothetical protein